MLPWRFGFSSRRRRSLVFIHHLSALLLILTFVSVDCRALDLTRTEKFVLEKLRREEIADLRAFSSDPKNQVLSHQFVEDLLAGRYNDSNIVRRGVRIANAVFDQAITVDSEIPYRVEFSNCTFNAGLDFSGSQFDKDLLFENAQFIAVAQGANSPDDGDSGEVLFIGATVKGTLTFSSTGDGPFYTTKFALPVDFTRLQAGGVVVYADFDFEQSNESSPDLDLSEANVISDFSITVFKDPPRYVEAQFLKVGGLMTLGSDGSAPQSAVTEFLPTMEFDLLQSHFQSVTIYGFNQWLHPNRAGSVSLDGVSFQYVYVDPAPEHSAWSLLQFVDSPHCRYSASPYLTLEQYLRSNGYPEWADDAFIRMRIRQRREAIWKHRRVAWVADWLLYQFTGYGRRPSRSLLVALALVFVGMFVFRDRNQIEPQDDKSKPGDYSSFWYSLDLLLPIIELGAASAWRPKQGWWFGRTYAPLQRIAGWILLPLILAAITGIIQ